MPKVGLGVQIYHPQLEWWGDILAVLEQETSFLQSYHLKFNEIYPYLHMP
jgi:hypothetical protein